MDYFTVATLQNQDKFMKLGKGWIIIEEHFHIVKMYKDKEVKNVNIFFVNV
jgi:hypothetical protein